MDQLTFGDADFVNKGKTTRKERFLAEMEQVVPWAAVQRVIEPFYAEGINGRRPYPHNSEVWSRNEAFDYRAPGAALNEYTAGFMQMVLEQVRSDDYEAAWKEIRAALTTAKYPLGRIGFFSTLGSGKQISLWLAPDRATFRSAGSPEEAVARVLGKTKARGLFDRLRQASSHVEVSELAPRPELKSPE